MSLRLKLITAILFSFIVMFGIFLWEENRFHSMQLQQAIGSMLDQIEHTFYHQMKRDIDVLSAARRSFVYNEEIRKLYLQKDRERLYEYCYPLFEQLRQKYRITHLYFQLPDSRTFLRVHNKSIYGDYTRRVTFRIAQLSGEPGEGLELGKTAFALRVVEPYYDGDELIGYVEFGEEIDHFIDEMKAQYPSIENMILVVRKDFLNREDWLSECTVKGIPDTWNAFDDYVVVGAMSNEIQPYLAGCITSDALGEIRDTNSLLGMVSSSENYSSVGAFPLLRADNKVVGAVVCSIDSSVFFNSRRKIFTRQAGMFVIILVVFVGLIYAIVHQSFIKPVRYLSRIARQIAQHGDLSTYSDITSHDEIGELSDSFNKMTHDLNAKTVSKKYLDDIVQNMVATLIVIDLEGTIMTVNTALCQLLGYEQDDIVGAPLNIILTDTQLLDDIYGLAQISTGVIVNRKSSYISRDCLHIPMLVSCSVLRDRYDQPKEIIISAKDMMEMAVAEKMLQNERDMLQQIIDAIPAPIFFKDCEGVYQGCNAAFTGFIGYPRDEIIGKTVYELAPRDMADIYHKMDMALLAHPVAQIYESKVRYADGERHDVIFHKAPYFDMGGNLKGLVGAILDITHRKQVEEENQLFKALSDNANYGVAILDVQGKIQYVNTYMAHIHGYAVEEVMGKHIRIFHTRKQFNQLMKYHDRLIDKGCVSIDELWHLRRDGSQFPMFVNSVLIRDSNATPTHITLTAMDISEQKQMKEELLKAMKLESIGILAGGIAHDFNNLLTAILGNVALAAMDVGDDPVRELLHNIENASMRARDLSQQLLTFSKGGAPVKKSASIDMIIRDSVGFTLKGSNVESIFDIQDGLLPVNIDKGQISQVINNLALNAIQSMPDGGTLTIRCRNTRFEADNRFNVYPGEYVSIEIQDQGSGIPADQLPKIFDPYFTTKEHGSGLGLATCYSIIKKHEGHIHVDSKVGRGSCFTLYLPAETAAFRVKKKNKPAISSGQGKILVMDDEEIVRTTVGQLVKRLGYDVCFAKNGAEAIELYARALEENEPFAVVIMDLTIPGGMGGKDAVQELLKIDVNVKAVVSSGYSNDPVMSNYREYGFCAVVRKPVSISDLSTTLSEAIA